MGCVSCGSKSPVGPINQVQQTSIRQTSQSIQPCNYTVAMLNDFNDKLEWFKSKQLYKKYNILAKTINKYLGVVLTSLNVNNRCMYEDTLNVISDLVDLIVIAQQQYPA